MIPAPKSNALRLSQRQLQLEKWLTCYIYASMCKHDGQVCLTSGESQKRMHSMSCSLLLRGICNAMTNPNALPRCSQPAGHAIQISEQQPTTSHASDSDAIKAVHRLGLRHTVIALGVDILAAHAPICGPSKRQQLTFLRATTQRIAFEPAADTQAEELQDSTCTDAA